MHGLQGDVVSSRLAVLAHSQPEAILQAVGREPLTAYQLAQRVFGGDYFTFEGRLRFSETLAHLELLARAGQVEKITEEDCILFAIAGGNAQ